MKTNWRFEMDFQDVDSEVFEILAGEAVENEYRRFLDAWDQMYDHPSGWGLLVVVHDYETEYFLSERVAANTAVCVKGTTHVEEAGPSR